MDRENHDRVVRAYWDIVSRVQSDPEYVRLRTELADLEPEYEAILAALSEEERITIDRTITLRETMNRRMLEFACGGFVHLK